MTRRFERPMVGAEPIMDGSVQHKKLHEKSFFTLGGPHSPPESPRTPEMLLGSMQGESDGRAAAQPPTIRMHPYGESPMATLLLRSSRSPKVPQEASSLARPPEPPAEHAAAKDRHVHGSAGRHQLATLPSSSLRGATFDGTERGHVVGTLRVT